MSAVTLTPAMSKALNLMSQARDLGRDPHGHAANTFDQPYLMDGQVFIALSTARALERCGLITIDEEWGDIMLHPRYRRGFRE